MMSEDETSSRSLDKTFGIGERKRVEEEGGKFRK